MANFYGQYAGFGSAVDHVPSWTFGGTNYGYNYGTGGDGTLPTDAGVEKLSLSSDGNSTDIGDMTAYRRTYGGQSSASYGYCSAGNPPAGGSDIIEKFPFASGVGTWTDVGNLTEGRHYVTSASSETHGYISGGAQTGAPSGHMDTIDNFPFASDTNASGVGDLLQRKSGWGGANSTTYAYDAGGYPGSHPYLKVIQKYSFTSDGNSTEVGDLLAITASMPGASSGEYGYCAGGDATAALVIQKWSFTSDGDSTDVGDPAPGPSSGCGVSSLTYGFTLGGGAGGSGHNTIQKWSFSSDGNSTDVGDMTKAGNLSGNGSQY